VPTAFTYLFVLLVVLLLLQLLGPQLSQAMDSDIAARRQRAEQGETRTRRLTARRRQRPTRPLLPEGHRPPPGLGPISPSPRAISAELDSGLRKLRAYLDDPQSWA
jgi:hypothetical protein